jgi:F-type H+-transporting ATPase subunit b
MTRKKLLVILALLLSPSLAFAQPRRIRPVPVPTAVTDENSGKAMEHEGPPGPIKLWDTQILGNKHPPYAAMLFNFALLLLLYWRYGKKPIAEALKNRKAAIASQIESAQRILREAKQRSKRYRAKLDRVTEDAEQSKQAEISAGEGDAKQILRSADEKAARLARDAEFLLDQEKKQTKIDLVRETVEKAAADAEELLRKNVSAQDQERLAEEFIAQLAADYEGGLPLGGAP